MTQAVLDRPFHKTLPRSSELDKLDFGKVFFFFKVKLNYNWEEGWSLNGLGGLDFIRRSFPSH